jgi:hypothetical protein
MKPDLRKVVGLAGENGIAALQGDTISMFSEGNIWLEDPNGNGGRLEVKNSGAVSLRIRGTEWKRAESNLDISAAYGPAFCDPLNQVDIASTLGKLPLALPKGARVKLAQASHGLTLVVYSISASTVRYDIRIALLQPTNSGNYLLIKADTVTEAGSVCGLQAVGGDRYVVLTDEPSGSSDFLALYVYAVAH